MDTMEDSPEFRGSPNYFEPARLVPHASGARSHWLKARGFKTGLMKCVPFQVPRMMIKQILPLVLTTRFRLIHLSRFACSENEQH